MKDKKRILIVDDEVDITTTFAMLFEVAGYDVRTASNGMEALILIRRDLPDIIVSDCMMPIMQGPELLRHFRTIAAAQEIPFILMSGNPEAHNLSSVIFDSFLQKPFPFGDLLLEVSRLLNIGKKGDFYGDNSETSVP